MIPPPPEATIVSSQDALIRVDEKGSIVGVNEVALRLLGRTAAEIEGRQLGSILADESMGAWLMRALLDSGAVVGEEVTLVAGDGTRVPVVCSAAVIGSPGGRPIDIVWIARRRATRNEVAEKLQAIEAALERERAERLRLLAELTAVRESQPKGEKETQPANGGGEKGAKEQLWAWAEEELRRVQSAFQRTRERLFRLEEELERAVRDREWVEERRRRSEEELQRVREEMQRLERQVRAAEGDRGTARPRSGSGRPSAPAPPEQSAATLQPPAELPQGHGIEWSDALVGVDGDLGFLRAIAEALAVDLPRLLGELRHATESGDAPLVERHARELKGAARSVGATVAAQTASRLETIARAGNLDEAEEVYIALQLEVARIEPALTALRELS